MIGRLAPEARSEALAAASKAGASKESTEAPTGPPQKRQRPS